MSEFVTESVETLADLIAMHDAYRVNEDGWTVCICGHIAVDDDDDGSHARHLAATIIASGAVRPAAEVTEALEACREQRNDLLELLQVEREEHAAALIRAWHEGYGAGSSDATDGWMKPGSPRTTNPYRAALAEEAQR